MLLRITAWLYCFYAFMFVSHEYSKLRALFKLSYLLQSLLPLLIRVHRSPDDRCTCQTGFDLTFFPFYFSQNLSLYHFYYMHTHARKGKWEYSDISMTMTRKLEQMDSKTLKSLTNVGLNVKHFSYRHCQVSQIMVSKRLKEKSSLLNGMPGIRVLHLRTIKTRQLLSLFYWLHRLDEFGGSIISEGKYYNDPFINNVLANDFSCESS